MVPTPEEHWHIQNGMNVFDSLPKMLRDFLNYSPRGYDIKDVWRLSREYDDALLTIFHLKNLE